MRLSSRARRFRRRQVFLGRGASQVLFASALAAMLLLAVVTPFARSNGASAGECPPGYVKEGSGLLARCVPRIDPGNIDLGVGDGQIEDGPDGVEAGDPPPQLTPVVIDIGPEAEETPTIDLMDVIDVVPDVPMIDPTGLPMLVSLDGPSISISKHQCPEGFDASAADYYDLAYNCSAAQSGVTFLVSDGDSQVFQVTTDESGSVEFVYLPAGPLSVVEQVPAGYGEPIVYCTSFVVVKDQVLETDSVRMTIDAGNQFFHIFDVEESMYCDWYNVPSGSGGSYQLTPVVVQQLTPVVTGQLTPVVENPTATPTPGS